MTRAQTRQASHARRKLRQKLRQAKKLDQRFRALMDASPVAISRARPEVQRANLARHRAWACYAKHLGQPGRWTPAELKQMHDEALELGRLMGLEKALTVNSTGALNETA